MRIFVSILIMILGILHALSTVSRMLIMITAQKAIKEFTNNSKTSIKLRNMQDNKESLKKALVMCILTSVLMIVFLIIVIIKTGFSVLTVAFGIAAVCSVFNIITTFIGYKNIEECYITSDGIIMYDGILKRNQNRFVIESGLSGKVNRQYGHSKNISVYRANMDIPFRFQIIDNDEEVIKLLQTFMLPEDMVERVTLMEEYYDEVSESIDKCGAKYISSEIAKKIETLTAYMDCGLWLEDYERDERGELPSSLKRGVLSQDGLYDLLTTYEAEKSTEDGTVE
ncbi:MAG: DUF4298 domain-containing protein [Lachnospira sp.]|nr:DUF4298 domain-containing protein [Lachnospira sp.]